MNNSIGLIAIASLALLLITATTMAQGVFAGGKHHHHGHGHGSVSNSQSLAQVNNCGNAFGASHVNCQNQGSQIQGKGNAVSINGIQK